MWPEALLTAKIQKWYTETGAGERLAEKGTSVLGSEIRVRMAPTFLFPRNAYGLGTQVKKDLGTARLVGTQVICLVPN